MKEYYELSSRRCGGDQRSRREGWRPGYRGGNNLSTVLETLADEQGRVHAGSAGPIFSSTPGYKFQVVDGMVTNFHLPKIQFADAGSAFAGREVIRPCLRACWLPKRYRFFSFGDGMAVVVKGVYWWR